MPIALAGAEAFGEKHLDGLKLIRSNKGARPVLDRGGRDNAGTCPLRFNRMGVAEVEFAFTMGRTLPPRAERYMADEVLDAVATLHPGIEVPHARFEPFERAGAPQLIADNACGGYFIQGRAAPAGLARPRPVPDIPSPVR